MVERWASGVKIGGLGLTVGLRVRGACVQGLFGPSERLRGLPRGPLYGRCASFLRLRSWGQEAQI